MLHLEYEGFLGCFFKYLIMLNISQTTNCIVIILSPPQSSFLFKIGILSGKNYLLLLGKAGISIYQRTNKN